MLRCFSYEIKYHFILFKFRLLYWIFRILILLLTFDEVDLTSFLTPIFFYAVLNRLGVYFFSLPVRYSRYNTLFYSLLIHIYFFRLAYKSLNSLSSEEVYTYLLISIELDSFVEEKASCIYLLRFINVGLFLSRCP